MSRTFAEVRELYDMFFEIIEFTKHDENIKFKFESGECVCYYGFKPHEYDGSISTWYVSFKDSSPDGGRSSTVCIECGNEIDFIAILETLKNFSAGWIMYTNSSKTQIRQQFDRVVHIIDIHETEEEIFQQSLVEDYPLRLSEYMEIAEWCRKLPAGIQIRHNYPGGLFKATDSDFSTFKELLKDVKRQAEDAYVSNFQ